MTTDPVERVARRIGTKAQAIGAIAEYKAWLTDQGIPIDKLLSGEMECVLTLPPSIKQMLAEMSPTEPEFVAAWKDRASMYLTNEQPDTKGKAV